MITTADRTALPAAILDNYLACILAKQRAYESGDGNRIDAARAAYNAARDDTWDVLNAANGKPVVYRGYVWTLGVTTSLSHAAYLTPDRITMEG